MGNLWFMTQIEAKNPVEYDAKNVFEKRIYRLL